MIWMVSMIAAVTVASSPSDIAVARAPTEKWVVKFEDARCEASRNYGTAEKPELLVLKVPAHHSVIRVQWIAKGTRAKTDQVKGTVQFHGQQPIDVSMLSYYSKDNGFRVQQMTVPADLFAGGVQSRSVRLKGKWVDETLQLSSLSPLLATLEKCVSSLRARWHVTNSGDDDAPVPGLKSHAKANLAEYFSGYDYPWMAAIKGQGGSVQFSLLIDRRGRVADCSVIEPSGVALLDAQSCAVLTERARFKPAIGTDGQPARDSAIGRIRWVAP